MSYQHIDNLYKSQDILLFRKCFALEKIHGTSAHITWKDGAVKFFSGGEKHARFVALFNEAALRTAFETLNHVECVIFGEAYGGSQQGQSWRYGKALKFAAFEVKIGDLWLSVPQAAQVATALGLEFVHYTLISTNLVALDAERDAPSEQARRNGVEGDQPREGIVLRPIIEVKKNNGERIVAKHKRDEERETKTPRKVVDPALVEVLVQAQAIADEWVTLTRLNHVLDAMGNDVSIERTREVITAMINDVIREGHEEIVDNKATRQAIGKATAFLFKEYLKSKITIQGEEFE